MISAEWEELPQIPGLYLAEMGALKVNARMSIYGTEMDVCKTISGVKALKYWKTDPVEVALYESGLPFVQSHLVKSLASCLKACVCMRLRIKMPCSAVCERAAVTGAGPDPRQPVLKLVGVYPVVNGYAQLNLQELKGKGQTGEQALHVYPGDLQTHTQGCPCLQILGTLIVM